MTSWPSRLKRAASSRSASAKPTALPTPWPSGPVVISMPGVPSASYSGWPAVGLPGLAEVLQVVHRDPVARQVQDRVQEHRGVAGAEHEPVAVEPVRVGRVVLHGLREELVGHRRKRHGGPRMTRVRLLHPVHGQRADGVDRQGVDLGLVLRQRHAVPSRSSGLVRAVSPKGATTRDQRVKRRRAGRRSRSRWTTWPSRPPGPRARPSRRGPRPRSPAAAAPRRRPPGA